MTQQRLAHPRLHGVPIQTGMRDEEPHHGHPHRIEVTPRPDLARALLDFQLWRRIAGGEGHAREMRLPEVLRGAGRPKVDQHRLTGRTHEDVARLDIAVHQTGGMDGVEGVVELRDDRRPDRPVPACSGMGNQLLSLHEIHGIEGRAPLRPGSTHRDHALVADAVQQACLAHHLVDPVGNISLTPGNRHEGTARGVPPDDLAQRELLDHAEVLKLQVAALVGNAEPTRRQRLLDHKPSPAVLRAIGQQPGPN